MDLITHTSLSPIRREFAPGFVNYKKGCTRLAATDHYNRMMQNSRESRKLLCGKIHNRSPNKHITCRMPGSREIQSEELNQTKWTCSKSKRLSDILHVMVIMIMCLHSGASKLPEILYVRRLWCHMITSVRWL
jgi:hypothetical protein